MFLTILNNQSIFSALEQFEILTFMGPEFGIFSWIFSFFVPKQIFTNFSFSFFLVFFYLVSLCELKSYLPGKINFSPLLNKDSDSNLVEDLLVSNSSDFELVLSEGESIVSYNYFDLYE